MKVLMNKFSILLIACLVGGSVLAKDVETAKPESVGLSSERMQRFSTAIEAGIDKGHLSGAIAAVARNGKVAFFETYGYQDKEAGVVMEDDAIFRLASMTKAITGVAVMMLYEEGHYSLNDPISKFIPSFRNATVLAPAEKAERLSAEQLENIDKKEWPEEALGEWLKNNWDNLSDEEQADWMTFFRNKENKSSTEPRAALPTVPAERPIRIRDLLRHTAGITYDMGEIWEEGDDLGEMIDKLAAQPLNSQPGTKFEYGLSIDVLARLVEVVSGQSFDIFLKQRIFDPLEMNDTAFYVTKKQAKRLVKMSISEGDEKDPKKIKGEDSYLSPPVVLMGGTGLVSTTMDYLRFCMMLLNNGELQGERILGRKSVELMRVNHMDDVENKEAGFKAEVELLFGLTFGIKGKPGETGELGSEGSYHWGGAYGTTFWIDPKENLTGVFMVNGLTEYTKDHITYGEMLEHFTNQAIID